MKVELKAVTKSYRAPGGTGDIIRVIRRVDLLVPAGECCLVKGPSGSGKSTLLALMAGLAFPDGGSVLWDELPLHPGRDLARRHGRSVGYAYQEGGFFHDLTVLENLLAPAVCAGGKIITGEAEHLLEQFGLTESFDCFPATLSGGEKRRLALARALLISPALLILDEPTAYLDQEWEERVMDLIFAMQLTTNATLIMATHGQLPGRNPDRVVRMAAGVVTEETSSDY